jgi:SAM-dependent methyltransferase
MLRALMTPETVRALARINAEFYRRHARLFASKRDRPWEGMRRVLEAVPAPGAVLDVGCGHGRFAQLLRERGVAASYQGVDASAELIEQARARCDLIGGARFARVDVIEALGEIPRGPFDLIALFGVIHHVPGEPTRAGLVRALAERLASGGTLAVAFWRTSADEDGARRVPWARANVDERELEPGDRLLRFDARDDALRYAHFADEDELMRLVAAVPLPLSQRFDADGAGGVANAYLLWRRP